MEIILVILLILLFNAFFIKSFASSFRINSANYLWVLFALHFVLTIAYLLYTLNARSDSFGYYNKTASVEDWFSLFENGTKFVGFVAWPFINGLNLSYLSVMIIFSYLGYIGIVLFYIIGIENISSINNNSGFGLIGYLFLLPNLHFWTSSLGKGSLMIFGIGLFTFGLSRFNKRVVYIIIGASIIYMVRSHILLAIILGIGIGVFLTNIGIKAFYKWLISISTVIAFVFLSGSVLKITDTDSLDITSSSILIHRATELSHANSGVDLQNYNLFFKLFTFWFRPLFFDGLGLLGFITSFENAFCLFMFFYLMLRLFKNWLNWNGLFRSWFFIFLFGSLILSQVSGNLGIAMRQKTQFMPFLFLLYIKARSDKNEINSRKLMTKPR